ncbi:TPA_asm: hypothetical protein GacPV1_gp13 [Geoglobus acetivorans pleomorphic virus 1]|uniref:Transglutaminase-like domain-containing protein n=3 Tax=root TaxID=1 RepID=A0A0A7GEJ9_GEOAI|nr:hypothetical protein GACE_1435 [Geoglobus acetivorans]
MISGCSDVQDAKKPDINETKSQIEQQYEKLSKGLEEYQKSFQKTAKTTTPQPVKTPTPSASAISKMYDFEIGYGQTYAIYMKSSGNIELGFSFASSRPVFVYVVPDQTNKELLLSRKSFNYYPALSFTSPATLGKKQGVVSGSFQIVFLNLGYEKAIVKAQVIAKPTSNPTATLSKTKILTIDRIVPPEVAEIFEKYRNNAIGFYEWVEANIKYREDTKDPYPGNEYWQSPYETIKDRAGDCEDMAILECAYYRYFGYEAYIAAVNTELNIPDHAICIVKIKSPTEFLPVLGKVDYYKIGDEYYLLVDNAYSDDFGYLTGGLKPKKFVIKRIFTLEETYLRNHKP